MDEDRIDSQMYRRRAEEIRVIAEGEKQLETYVPLMKIAADYDRMARSAEAIAESKDALQKAEISK